MAGEGEEDVVEGRAAQTDVVDHDARVAEVADDLDEALRPAEGGDGDAAGMGVERALAALGHELASTRDVVRTVDDHLDALTADLRLQVVGGALGDDAAVVDDRDLV